MKDTVEDHHQETISTIAFEVGLDYDVAISYHIQTKERFESRQNYPFVENVLSEGRFYG